MVDGREAGAGAGAGARTSGGGNGSTVIVGLSLSSNVSSAHIKPAVENTGSRRNLVRLLVQH
jgi:hypothetical protein